MEKLSLAQDSFAKDVLEISYDIDNDQALSRDQLRANLAKAGILNFTESDFDALCGSLSDQNGQLSNTFRYAKGHLFPLYAKRTDLQDQIATKLCGMNQEDFRNLDLFQNRIVKLSELASERNCLLYVDAE